MTSISFITIGNELLKGTIVNTNASDAGLILRKYGYALDRVIMIADTEEAIREAIEKEMAMHDIVLVSGGLGPTKDDVTKYTLAKIFESDWVMHAPTLAHLEARYASEGIGLNDLTRLQAKVPSICEVVPNALGTAPAMAFQREGSWLFAMPGVPYEMRHILEHEIVPRLQTSYPTAHLVRHIFRLADIPESHAAQRMETIEEGFDPMIQIAYLPREDGIWLELTASGPRDTQQHIEEVMTQAVKAVRVLFEDKAYAEGDATIPVLVRDFFQEKKLTLAVAESITGGGIAARLVEASGSSDYLKGGVTAYSTQIKIEQLGVDPALIEAEGIVSEAVALAMAEGVRKLLKADIGLATTGWVEKNEKIPAQVWIGLKGKDLEASRWAKLRYRRKINLNRASFYALQLCLKKVMNHF
ncbi:MAG: nicotinamide-nucleotide amidohydrolase family protein [Bacteroidota bacterium]